MEIATLKEKATHLRELRAQISEIEQRHEDELKDLKGQRDTLQASLVEDMTSVGLPSFRTDEGETITKAVRHSIAIVNEFFALQWAREHQAIKVDTALVAQMAKNGMELPEHIFRPVETSYISVKSPKSEE